MIRDNPTMHIIKQSWPNVVAFDSIRTIDSTSMFHLTDFLCSAQKKVEKT